MIGVITGLLADSEFDNERALWDIISNSFETKTKREFSGTEEYALVQVGSRGLNNPMLSIRNGYLRLKT